VVNGGSIHVHVEAESLLFPVQHVSDATLNETEPHDARLLVQGTQDIERADVLIIPYISVGHLQEPKPTPPFPMEKDLLTIAPVKLESQGKHVVLKTEFNSI
jgi:hypothetical protein